MLQAGKKTPESPKINRSQSFVSHQPRPFGPRPESSGSEPIDFARRPRSSDAKSESQMESADGQLRSLRISEPGEIRAERGTQSARASVDRDTRGPFSAHGLQFDGLDTDRSITVGAISPSSYKTSSPIISKTEASHEDVKPKFEPTKAGDDPSAPAPHKPAHQVAAIEITVPSRAPIHTDTDQSSDSDDEDMNDYFDAEIAKAEAELQRLETEDESLNPEAYIRAGLLQATFAAKLAELPPILGHILGPIPEDENIPWDLESESAAGKSTADAMDIVKEAVPVPVPAGQQLLLPEITDEKKTEDTDDGPRPKVEEMDTDAVPLLPLPTVERDDARPDDGDVAMTDVRDGEEQHLLVPPGGPTALANGDYGEASRPTTPSQMEEDDDATEVDEVDSTTIETVRNYMKTPPIDELPDYSCTPWYQDKQFLMSSSPSHGLSAYVLADMKEQALARCAEQDEIRLDYSDKYKVYLHFTLSDPQAVKSREKFTDPAPPPEVVAAAISTVEPKPEGRRPGRFGTDRDIERILQASKREEEERREREQRAQKEKFRSEKEAVIPNMYWTHEERDKDLYIDKSGYLPPEKLVAAWQILPPIVNFTEEEAEQFEKAYLEFPKQWGRIAEQIPKRDFHACIQYYYVKKRELNLKEKLKRQPRRRKKGSRGKQRSSALVSELGNGEDPPEEPTENGENGERRRPRRAAAPTWNFEAASAVDSDGATPAGTPGRRRNAAAAAAASDNASKNNDSGAEKPEGKKGRKRGPKEKEPKAKPAQALAPTPAPGAKSNRSRSNSRAQGPSEWQATQGQPEVTRLPTQFEVPPAGMQPPMVTPQPLVSPERAPPPTAASSISEVMAAPSLRPEPLPLAQAAMPTFDIGSAAPPPERRPATQASSYWSVSETNDFPAFLRSFGTDWQSIAAHMQTKTAVMVRNLVLFLFSFSFSLLSLSLHLVLIKILPGQKLLCPPEGSGQVGMGAYRFRSRC